MNASSQKREKITVSSSLSQDQILINIYNTGITAYTSRKIKTKLTLFDMGGGAMMAPQNVFDHCAQKLWRRKLKLGDF